MTFTCSDQHVSDFHHHGYTIFRGILPTSLVADLRRAFEPGYALVRSAQDVDTQRLQPVKDWTIEQAPFRDFLELPALRDAIQRVLSPGHAMTDALLGVLIQPAQRPWHMAWHRDWVRPDLSPDCAAEIRARLADVRLFNQMNCALYDDPCLWYVPGSAARADLPGEVSAANHPTGKGSLADHTCEEVERIGLDYMRRMPGAVPVPLAAGDFLLYRQNGWHAAHYVTYRKRATLHNIIETDESRRWLEEITRRLQSPTEQTPAPVGP